MAPRGLLQSLPALFTPAPGKLSLAVDPNPEFIPKVLALGMEAPRTAEERWQPRGKEEAKGSSAAESVRSRHLLDAVAWRALSHSLQPVSRKDASGSFDCRRACILHIKYFNKCMCQEVASTTGTHAQGKEKHRQEAVYLCAIATPHPSFVHQSLDRPDPYLWAEKVEIILTEDSIKSF